ncbi:glycosyltransferase family 2 protein [Desulfopila aestuarii]|uniref:Glycosyl transferase family 2 n=1 Tax=Desulfopila aestuarii DSM 18488 TaxID=1121416 RepID=A0A1M7Y1Q4_9BACT|nr:glycosyltransferase [Desulfopila aestuarii]SHO45759.1 Glycosyl transferase family 2 [Desulfopila aestuarii DSM 18488]
MNTTIAIITRTKDRPLLLRRAIESVLNQSEPNWHHVIVNDAGRKADVDSTLLPFLERYNGRLTIIHHPEPIGMEAASNAGISAKQSKYILIHDDDDSLHPVFLSRTKSYLEKSSHNVGGVVTLTTKVDEVIVNNRIKTLKTALYKELAPKIGIGDMARVNQFPPISFLFRRSVIDCIGMYNESLPVLGDWDFNLRLMAQFDVDVIHEPLSNYHHRTSQGDNQMSNSVHEKPNIHIYYDTQIRNQYLRNPETVHLGNLLLLQKDLVTIENLQREYYGNAEKLHRLYKHPVIGRFIKLWSRFINSSIPHEP